MRDRNSLNWELLPKLLPKQVRQADFEGDRQKRKIEKIAVNIELLRLLETRGNGRFRFSKPPPSATRPRLQSMFLRLAFIANLGDLSSLVKCLFPFGFGLGLFLSGLFFVPFE